MYVWMYVCMDVCMYVCMSVYDVNTKVCVHGWLWGQMVGCAHAHRLAQKEL